MIDDIVLGVSIFVMLVILAAVGRKFGFAHSDVWS